MRFLVFDPGGLPHSGAGTRGAAHRTSGIVEGLRAHGHEVEVSALLPGHPETRPAPASAPDVVVLASGKGGVLEARLPQPVVLDLGRPIEDELDAASPERSAALRGTLAVVAQADYFLVSGPRQRLYSLPFLLRAGVEQPEKRVLTVPTPLRPRPADRPRPVSSGSGMPRLVSLEPPAHAEGLLGIGAAIAERGGGKAVDGSILPDEALLGELSRADVALALGGWSLKAQWTTPWPAAAALWSGVPLVCRAETDLGDLVERYDAGWTAGPPGGVPPERIRAEILDSPDAVARKGANASALAREVFSWDRAVAPLLEAVRTGGRAQRREVDVSVAWPEDHSLAVVADRPLEQRFLSRVDGLCRVECFLSRRGRSPVAPLVLGLYRLGGSETGAGAPRHLVARRDVADAEIRDNEWVDLEFEPVPDSAGATFGFTIESVARDVGESVSPWMVRSQPFPLVELRHGGKHVRRRALCFRSMAARGAP